MNIHAFALDDLEQAGWPTLLHRFDQARNLAAIEGARSKAERGGTAPVIAPAMTEKPAAEVVREGAHISVNIKKMLRTCVGDT